MDTKIILIIGGPGSGKTTLINELTNKGYVCYPEISRAVTKKAQEKGIDQLFLTEPLLFSQLLLEGRIEQHKEAVQESANIVFIDRGIPDVLAYMHFTGDQYPESFDIACKEHIYHQIFLLPPWESIYQSDEQRYENFEQASQIHEHLISTYKSYGYDLVEVPRDTVENRIDFILSRI
ncbi:ATP-binding protein [Myroides marinus]|jgi:predicted ATPase|uniref:ATPase n=1 Tax=Myroides marinus TaxID=703342 RepID=A0A163ZN37_9FLAO|nr:AAA family ATPase [Myroides marinus]MDR0229636.1 ATP-binding protein [Flavobacteriaceae bacterium]KUF39438.1 ATPase [Myroides marinus]KZE82107.1 ATPase [Myroides marinus]MDM1345880.1 ATP-binding protein [Myroides marinus]MDM1349259.1 ATP-binding protein [Myroides marinus]